MNYPVVIGVSVLVIMLIIWLINRNIKDKKEYEEELAESDLPADEEKKTLL